MSEGVVQVVTPGNEESAQTGPSTRLYYGWVMLPLSMAALIASSPGQTFGVSVFNEPMRLSLGLTHGQLALAYMLGTLCGAVPITCIGWLMDRVGLKRTLLGAVSLFALACLFLSLAHGWLALMAAFCLLRMLGPGGLAFLSGNTLAFWFDQRLGMVEGLRQLSMAAAMAMIPAFNLWLVNHWGWRGAYILLGIGIWVVLFPVFAIFFRNRPDELGQAIDGRRLPKNSAPDKLAPAASLDGLSLSETIRTRAFWIVASGTALFGLIHTAVFFCMAPIFQERGLSVQDAATMLSVFAACLAVMQLGGGILADRVPAPYLLSAGMAGLAVGIWLLLQASTTPLAHAAGAVLGLAQGTYFGATHPLWARYFGRRSLGRIRGVLMTMVVASSSLGPLLAGLTKDWLGTFGLALTIFAIAPLPLALLSLIVQAPRRNAEPDIEAAC